MKLGTKIAAIPIVLLFLGLGQQVQAYWGGGYGPGNWGGPGGGCEGCGGLLGLWSGLWGGGGLENGGGWYHQGAYQNGYYAGTQDAIYDHENNSG